MMMNEDDRTVFVNIDKVMPKMAAPMETMTEEELSEEVGAVIAEKEAEDYEMQLEELYWKLGKAYYEGGFEDPLPELLPFFDKITALRNQMEETGERAVEKEIVENVAGEAPVAETIAEEIPAAEAAAQEAAARPNRCPSCGAELEEDAKFCGNCGCRVG